MDQRKNGQRQKGQRKKGPQQNGPRKSGRAIKSCTPFMDRLLLLFYIHFA